MAESLSRVVIVADDDEGDRFLILKALEDNGVTMNVQFLEDGQKLIDRLRHSVAASAVPTPPLPCLILLDLNMPRIDGREVLRVIKRDPALKRIPVVVLSSSKNPADVASSYEDGANSFFTKPLNYSGLVGLMGLLKSYWLDAAQLPVAPA